MLGKVTYVNPNLGEPPTGEPCAGDPPARFGGRGSSRSPYPYLWFLAARSGHIFLKNYWIASANCFLCTLPVEAEGILRRALWIEGPAQFPVKPSTEYTSPQPHSVFGCGWPLSFICHSLTHFQEIRDPTTNWLLINDLTQPRQTSSTLSTCILSSPVERL